MVRFAAIPFVAVALSCVLPACTITDLTTPDQLSAHPQFVTILPMVPRDATVIGPVKAELCQKLKTDPAYDQEDVYLALKRQAVLAGGTGLADVSISIIDRGTRTCFWSGAASGIAYRREPK